MPAELWVDATKIAARCGLYATAKGLGIDYGTLAKRVKLGAAHEGALVPSDASEPGHGEMEAATSPEAASISSSNISPEPSDPDSGEVVRSSRADIPLAATLGVTSVRKPGLVSFTFAVGFKRLLSCPAGKAPEDQHMAGGQLIARFSAQDCSTCPFAAGCQLRILANGDRQLRRAPETIATEVRQHEQQQPEFKEQYRKRSGIESTNSEAKGRHGLGKLRIRGKPKVALVAKLKALAINVKRAVMYHVSMLGSDSPVPCQT